MPNWCNNELSVYGDKDEIARFKKNAKSKDSDFSMEKLCPMPKELEGTHSPINIISDKEYEKETKRIKAKGGTNWSITNKMSEELIEKYGFNNWYDWNIANWGCKWDVSAELQDWLDDGTCLTYIFDSPWGPPVKIFDKLVKDYPKLTFVLKYDEPGMCFRGAITAKDGKVEDKYIEYG